MEFLRCAPLKPNKQAETGGKYVGARSALSVTSDAAEEIFPAKTTFQKATNYHMSIFWEVQGIQKWAELVGKRRNVRKLLMVGTWFVRASQPVRYSTCSTKAKKCSQ